MLTGLLFLSLVEYLCQCKKQAAVQAFQAQENTVIICEVYGY